MDRLEEWVEIPGWEGFYEASTHGRVRSLDRMVRHSDGSMRKAADMARRFGVTPGTICDIQKGRSWKHAYALEVST